MKVRILLLGATMASLAGVLWAVYANLATQSTWDVTFTITLLTYVIVGGVSSPFGAAAGAAVVGGMQYFGAGIVHARPRASRPSSTRSSSAASS